MDDLKYGTRNKRGDWAPNEPLAYAPRILFPPRLLAILKWLPHYSFPGTPSSPLRRSPTGPG